MMHFQGDKVPRNIEPSAQRTVTPIASSYWLLLIIHEYCADNFTECGTEEFIGAKLERRKSCMFEHSRPSKLEAVDKKLKTSWINLFQVYSRREC